MSEIHDSHQSIHSNIVKQSEDTAIRDDAPIEESGIAGGVSGSQKNSEPVEDIDIMTEGS